ncbi:biotin/lipoyl-containing protein [Allorhizocola rhizosphaerae]|uniref:biotin/lipoyl-containing protein n=1 Tax=Allorhizocola rhizosphaerae TaxID=1872709 RepID=UPI000E3CD17C|nr:biotin/lipoyl-containing protein [Allorhizocola rhizosphaerae]
MKHVLIPTPDVNSEHGVVTAWFVENGQWVEAGTDLVEVETSKAVLEVSAPDSGYILQLGALKDEVSLTAPIALLFDDIDSLKAHQASLLAAPKPESPVRASVKAIKRAEELGVDLSSFDGSRLITVKDVEAAAFVEPDYKDMPSPLTAPEGVQRILIIGAGRGATQVIDIFADRPEQTAVAIVDEQRGKWGELIDDVPVVGGPDRLTELYEHGRFDAVVVAISTSVAARRKFRLMCEQAGIPLANAIDRTAKIATNVEMGEGNVICAFCHIGTATQIGNNNFFSAYNSFDHHNVVANDSSTGPGCMTSSRVKLGDQVRLGTGIHIEPGVELGDRVQVASGATIVRSVPADHVVKTKIVTTVVVPGR